MKKDIITILALIMLISCGCSIERKNPTDPLSSNYIGWHFIGTIGSFSVLADFVATPDHIYCVDSYDLMAYKYKTDGTYVLGWGNNPPPAAPIFTSPNALC
ncbi:MAG TPA: hypothetical protein ENN43_03200, partial [bacterium]|nr:hypothetical protein [bacterium]